jgi:glutathione S-transferase
MKLYFFPVAPNPTKVRLYLAEKEHAGTSLGVEQVQIDLPSGEQKSEAFRARNSFARLPVLELDDGTHLTESLSIIEYLEELHPEPAMIGSDPLGRARVRNLERIVDLEVLVAIGRVVHATRSPLGLAPVPEVAERARAGLPAAFAYLDELLSDGRAFLAGERPSVADCSLAAGLQFGRFGGVELDPSWQHVAGWDARYREREPARGVLVA